MRRRPRQKLEVIPLRVYFHCGWGVQVDQTFEGEILNAGEMLRVYEPSGRRELHLSSIALRRHDGQPLLPAELAEFLDSFPPPEMTGLRYKHQRAGHVGRALWMFGDDDQAGPAWVLMGLTVSEAARKAARVTVVCEDEADRDWAVERWRSVLCTEGVIPGLPPR